MPTYNKDAYSLSRAFGRIERELIESMTRNMRRHQAEETDYGFDWPQWQALQLQELERYRKENAEKYTEEFKNLNDQIGEAIRQAYESGQGDQEAAILEMIKSGKLSANKSMDADFFRVNSRRIDALVEATTNDIQKAEQAILRMADDKYRRTIYDAQVYFASGAGTYAKAVDMATHDMLMAGLNCVEYKNGARHTLQDYADMAIRTSGQRAYLRGEGQKRNEWGIHTVIANKRGNPCPKCAPWCGKVMIDDVYAGATAAEAKESGYPRVSTAMKAGFLHPRCKDTYTTYFPGISQKPKPWTKEELAELEEEARREVEQQHAEKMAEKCDRVAKNSLDPEKQKTYEKRAEQWEEKAEKLKKDAPETAEGADKSTEPKVPAISPERQAEIDEALEYYVSGEGMFVNEHLAGTFEKNGGVWTKEDEELLKLLDEGTQEPVKQKKLWRSVDASSVFGKMSDSEFWDLESYILYGESSVPASTADKLKKRIAIEGKEITEPRFMSTTTDKELAMEWRDFSGSSRPIVLELDVPRGIKGADLKRFDLPEDPQNEVLLHRGQKYRVKSIGSEDGTIVVKAELIPEKAAGEAKKKVADVKPVQPKVNAASDIQAKVSGFVPAKTIEEAQEYAKKYIEPQFMDKTFKGQAVFKGISIEHANEINQALTEVFEQFPDLEKLSGIKAISPSSAAGKKAFKDGADALFSYDPIQHGIYINKDILKNAKAFEEHKKRSREAWDLVMENMDKMSGSQKELAERYASAGRSLVDSDTVKGLFTHELGHHVQWTMLDAKTTNAITSRMKQFAPKISGYAQASSSEYLAESFAAYMKGERRLLDPEYVRVLDSKVKLKKRTVLVGNPDAVKEPIVFTISENHSIIGTQEQLGKKFRRHCKDYGRDPSNEEDRNWVIAHIQDILQNKTAKYPGTFMGQGKDPTTGKSIRGKVIFYELGNDVVIVNAADTEFISLLKDAVKTNSSVKEARNAYFRAKGK